MSPAVALALKAHILTPLVNLVLSSPPLLPSVHTGSEVERKSQTLQLLLCIFCVSQSTGSLNSPMLNERAKSLAGED